MVVTDGELNLLDEGLDIVINVADDVLDTMIPFVRDMHTRTGLVERALRSTVDVAEAALFFACTTHWMTANPLPRPPRSICR